MCECAIIEDMCACDDISVRLPQLASLDQLQLVMYLHYEPTFAHCLRDIFAHADQYERDSHRAFCTQRPDVLCIFLRTVLFPSSTAADFDQQSHEVADLLLAQEYWVQAIPIQERYDFLRMVSHWGLQTRDNASDGALD